MHYFPLTLFQFFGIFPFTVTNHKVKRSKFLYIWSVLITSTFTVLSIKRCLIYFDFGSELKIGFVSLILVKFESFWALLEICLSTTPIHISLNQCIKYVQSIFNLSSSSNKINKKMMAVLMVTLVEWYMLFKIVQDVYYPIFGSIPEYYLDIIITPIQTFVRSAHLLHFFVAINAMVEHLRNVEGNLKNWEIKKVFDEYYKVLIAYKQLGKLYQTFMSFILVEVFYHTMIGLKRLQDHVFFDGTAERGADLFAYTVFWYWFNIPLLMLVLHEGHLFHQQVLYENSRLTHSVLFYLLLGFKYFTDNKQTYYH